MASESIEKIIDQEERKKSKTEVAFKPIVSRPVVPREENKEELKEAEI